MPDVLTIGNALVDVLSHEDDAFLLEHDLVKGSMHLIDHSRAEELYGAMGPGIEVSGGCAANTAAGVVSFGGTAAFLGKVRDDQFGSLYRHDLSSVGVTSEVPAAPADAEDPTGRCLIMVTPDGERTLNTHLGIAAKVSVDDVDPAVVASAGLVYVEGYLWDIESTKDAIRKVLDSTADGARFAFTMSDSFCVERHLDEWVTLVDEQVDVLFGNAEEVQVLCGTGFDEAVRQLQGRVKVAVITRGAAGSVVATEDDVIEVAPEAVASIVDTTGAGDLYAAGFLYGYTQGLPLAECGRLGSLAAAEVISHTGARPLTPLARLLTPRGEVRYAP